MKIFSNEETKKTSDNVILVISFNEANCIYDAMEEYVKNNKRKVNAKKLLKQMFSDMPYTKV